ncbi:hypothetical protein CVT26_010445 [Gymnopilus dilepis]|uniref:CCHC-type domain-containing protein n=1 Tax=Gymnopilus dilepis TaxID=231916 RepID=A0A409Y0H8_9AGAR|nr:hypothetical protein CVT26_010445 [Gymnopilus dilepis]
MAESGGLHTKLFWGDGELEGENPQDFFNSVELTFFARPGITEAEKLRSFELRLKSGRAAKTWWNALAAEKKDTWEHLREAFEEKWPEKVITEKTKEEQHAALAAAVLREEDLGKRVRKDGVEEFSHVVWADKVQRLASALTDSSGLLIPMVRKSMPRSLKRLVGTQHTDWSSFCAAVRAVSITELEERLEVEKEARAIQATIARLERLQLRPSAGGAAPQVQSQAVPLGAPALRSSQPNPTPQYRADTERIKDVVRLALPIHPDTPAGRTAYQAQVADWNRTNAGRTPNELRPYPLTPGTVPVASGECWTCGHLGHNGLACPSPTPVPQMERKWRSIAATIKRRAEASPAPVNVVSEAVLTEEELQLIAEYRANQGNVEGSSA